MFVCIEGWLVSSRLYTIGSDPELLYLHNDFKFSRIPSILYSRHVEEAAHEKGDFFESITLENLFKKFRLKYWPNKNVEYLNFKELVITVNVGELQIDKHGWKHPIIHSKYQHMQRNLFYWVVNVVFYNVDMITCRCCRIKSSFIPSYWNVSNQYFSSYTFSTSSLALESKVPSADIDFRTFSKCLRLVFKHPCHHKKEPSPPPLPKSKKTINFIGKVPKIAPYLSR